MSREAVEGEHAPLQGSVEHDEIPRALWELLEDIEDWSGSSGSYVAAFRKGFVDKRYLSDVLALLKDNSAT